MLSIKAIQEFKEIYFEEYGINLSEEEANRQANDLINLFKVFFRKKGSNYIPKIELK